MKIYSETDTSLFIEVNDNMIVSFNDEVQDKQIALNIEIDTDYIDDEYNWGFNPTIIGLYTEQMFDYDEDTSYYEVEIIYKGKRVKLFDYYYY